MIRLTHVCDPTRGQTYYFPQTALVGIAVLDLASGRRTVGGAAALRRRLAPRRLPLAFHDVLVDLLVVFAVVLGFWSGAS